MLGCWKPLSFRFQSTVGAEHMQDVHFPKNERMLFPHRDPGAKELTEGLLRVQL